MRGSSFIKRRRELIPAEEEWLDLRMMNGRKALKIGPQRMARIPEGSIHRQYTEYRPLKALKSSQT
jgi:hypothetical protein